MANILDYIRWRGDITLAQSAFCDVDAMVLSRLSYLPFEDIVPQSFTGEGISVRVACARYLAQPEDRQHFIQKEDADLMHLAGDSDRYGQMRLFGCIYDFDEEKQEQFFAICIDMGDGRIFVSFRGTDNTVVGWKEDFNMSFSFPVPAQIASEDYVRTLAMMRKQRLILGGHSKGGNLAIYAAVYAPKGVRERIDMVYNMDGPGFVEKIVSKNGAVDFLPKIKTFAPQSSVIGMLFEHEEEYTVVHSPENAIMQHDIYSWQVMGSKIICLEAFTPTSQRLNSTVGDWISRLDDKQRESFVQTIFYIIEQTQIKEFKQLPENLLSNTGTILKTIAKLDDNTRAAVKETLSLLFDSVKRTVTISLPQREKDENKL